MATMAKLKPVVIIKTTKIAAVQKAGKPPKVTGGTLIAAIKPTSRKRK